MILHAPPPPMPRTVPESPDWVLRTLLKELGNRRVELNDRRMLAREAIARLLRKREVPQAALLQVAYLAGDQRLEVNYRRDLATDLLIHLAEPHRLFRQLAGRGTCAATAPAYNFLCDQPAEFARITVELARSGEARLPNHDRVRLSVHPAQIDARGYNTRVERIVQTAFMTYAAGHAYDPDLDRLHSGQRGLLPEQTARLLSALYQRPFEVWTSTGRNHPQQLRKSLESLRSGLPVVGILSWEGEGYHAVSLTSQRGGQVYFRNPWGRPQPGSTGPGHEQLSHGTERMETLEFSRRLTCLVYPRGALPRPGPPPPPTLPEKPELRRYPVNTLPLHHNRSSRDYWKLASAPPDAPAHPTLESLSRDLTESPGRRGVPVRLYRPVEPLPVYKKVARVGMGVALGACLVSIFGAMAGAPPGPAVQIAGAAAVGTLAFFEARSQDRPIELERGRLYERDGQLLYQQKADGLIAWNVGPPEPV